MFFLVLNINRGTLCVPLLIYRLYRPCVPCILHKSSRPPCSTEEKQDRICDPAYLVETRGLEPTPRFARRQGAPTFALSPHHLHLAQVFSTTVFRQRKRTAPAVLFLWWKRWDSNPCLASLGGKMHRRFSFPPHHLHLAQVFSTTVFRQRKRTAPAVLFLWWKRGDSNP